MSTREEYAEAAAHAESLAMLREGHFADMHRLAARVLRALADGAVLCKTQGQIQGDDYVVRYIPLEQP